MPTPPALVHRRQVVEQEEAGESGLEYCISPQRPPPHPTHEVSNYGTSRRGAATEHRRTDVFLL